MGNVYSEIISEYSQVTPYPMEVLVQYGAEWKEGHFKNLTILSGVSGITSTISSSTLIWMIARSHVGVSSTHHRLLIGLSIFDIISSLSRSTFNAAAPSEDAYETWNARGNERTCDAQGFLVTLGMFGGLFYNAALSLYYLASVRYGWSEDYIRNKIEPFLHGVPILVALVHSVALLLGKHFNNNGIGSCIASVNYPLHCDGYNVGETRDGFEIPCGRGLKGSGIDFISNMVLYFAPAAIMAVSLAMIYAAVRQQENKNKRYGVAALRATVSNTVSQQDSEHSSGLWASIKKASLRWSSSVSNPNASTTSVTRINNSRSKSRAVMHKAFGYAFAWLLAYGAELVNYFMYLTNDGTYSLTLLYFYAIFVPLQGFFNLVIFMLPKVMSARKPKGRRGKKVPWCRTISNAFWSRGKKKTRKGQRKASSLRNQRRRPLRSRNGKFRRMKFSRRGPQEEEEKCEILPMCAPPSALLDTPRKNDEMVDPVEEVMEMGGIGNENVTGIGLFKNAKQNRREAQDEEEKCKLSLTHINPRQKIPRYPNVCFKLNITVTDNNDEDSAVVMEMGGSGTKNVMDNDSTALKHEEESNNMVAMATIGGEGDSESLYFEEDVEETADDDVVQNEDGLLVEEGGEVEMDVCKDEASNGSVAAEEGDPESLYSEKDAEENGNNDVLRSEGGLLAEEGGVIVTDFCKNEASNENVVHLIGGWANEFIIFDV